MRLFRCVMLVLVLMAAIPLVGWIASAVAESLLNCTAQGASCPAGGVVPAFASASRFLFAALPILLALLIHWTFVELIYRRALRRV
jgi:hypothetical protein